MQKEDAELITNTIDCISNLSNQSDEALDNVVDKAHDNTLLGAAMMIGGAILTPFCPPLGIGVAEFGYGFTIGSTVIGGLAVGAKVVKNI